MKSAFYLPAPRLAQGSVLEVDVTPESAAGRAVAAAVMITGIALVPAVTSIIVAILIERLRQDSEDR